LKLIAPERAAELMRQGAMLVDVREADEFAREHIVGAKHRPLSAIAAGGAAGAAGQAVIFHCRSGGRTLINAEKLLPLAQGDTYILEGGIEAWKQAGLAVEAGQNS
jgi:rhodanese-related sulfurtransferase